MFYFKCMGILSVSIHHVPSCCPGRSEDGIRFLGPGAMQGSELLYRCWELNLETI